MLDGMRRPGRLDAVIVLVAAAVAGVAAALDGAGWADWLFGTVLLASLGVAVRLAVVAAHRARQESARAERLTQTRPDDVALAAVHEESRRLHADTLVVLRGCLRIVLDEVDHLDADHPVPALRRVHEQTQLATSELRRQLGLLRADPPPDDRPTDPTVGTRLNRADVVIAVALVALAVVETVTFSRVEGAAASGASVGMTALAAAPVLLRRTAPGLGCLLVAVVFGLGIVLDASVVPSFWAIGTLGSLLWTVASRATSWSPDGVAAAALVSTSVLSVQLSAPENVAAVVLILAGAVGGGLAVRRARRRERESRTAVRLREAELGAAALEAVTAARSGFARDLHDVVSHAVGLIAVQASAGQVSWPRHPQDVERCVAVVRDTARSTLAELDRLIPAQSSASRSMADVGSLVDRVRAAGTPVALTTKGTVPDSLLPTVHRVVQEALTNVVRHAPGSAAEVSIDARPDGVTVRVVDVDSPAPGTSGRGYGLVGLAERVEFVGGTLTTGPREGGGFVVDAWMPATPVVVP